MIAEGFIRQLYGHIAEPKARLKRQNVQIDKLIQDISKAETCLLRRSFGTILSCGTGHFYHGIPSGSAIYP